MKREDDNYAPIYKPVVKYQFPSIMTTFGRWTTLDGTQELIHPTYYKYDDGTESNLTCEERIYNLWVKEADKKIVESRTKYPIDLKPLKP